MSKDEWGTPQELFDELDETFHFTLDPCASATRILKSNCRMLSVTSETDGLSISWKNHSVFVNPPYSGKSLRRWVEKCHEERHSASNLILLVPSRIIGTSYFQELLLPWVALLMYVKGRIQFIPLAGQPKGSNPQSSIICIMQSSEEEMDLTSIQSLTDPGDFENLHS